MKEQLQTRLAALKAEFDSGQERLAEVENQATQLRQTLLRISGAIQVLEEDLAASGVETGTDASASAASPEKDRSSRAETKGSTNEQPD
jgi:predicted nuclease with TOPRIM domain